MGKEKAGTITEDRIPQVYPQKEQDGTHYEAQGVGLSEKKENRGKYVWPCECGKV